MKIFNILYVSRTLQLLKISLSPVSRSMATTIETTTTSNSSVKSLLSGEEALSLLGKSNVKFVDASWHLVKNRDARIEFLTERIPGAVYFDIDFVSDSSSSLPHMLPSEKQFESQISELGINSEDHIVVYTQKGCFSAPRVWWTFKCFGHNRISVLDGGINSWKTVNGPIDKGALPHIEKGNFKAKFNENYVVDWKDVLKVVETGSSQILDARSNARFLAQAPEPRPNLEGGRIPGSLNLPHVYLTKEDDITSFRSKEEIRDAFKNAGIVFGSRIILSCGSGVSAATLAFGLELIGKDLNTCPIYDGSWSEWGDKSRTDLPKLK